jgi:SPFH domain / Band 7 family
MKLKYLITFFILFTGLGLITSRCSVFTEVFYGTLVQPDQTVLRVDRIGESAGFEKAQEVSGSYRNTTDVQHYAVSKRIQNYVFTSSIVEGAPRDESIQFRTKDGFKIQVNLSVSFLIVDAKKFISQLKYDDERFIAEFLYTAVRESVNKKGSRYALNDLIAIPGQVTKDTSLNLDEFQNNVLLDLNLTANPVGVKILKAVAVNGFSPPEEISAQVLASQQQIIELQKQTQTTTLNSTRIQKEVQTAKAQLQLSKLQSETKRLEVAQITQNYLILEAIKRWNGSFVVVGNAPTIAPAK